MGSYVILCLFAAVSLIHLYGCWAGSGRLNAMTKPALVLLLAFYVVARAGAVSPWWLVGALAASWLGDVLLMKNGDGWFVAGGIAFLIAHILFVTVYARQIRFGAVPAWPLCAAAAVYVAAMAAVIWRIRARAPGWMLVPIAVYLLCNTVMNLFALTQLLTRPGPGSWMAFAGAALFFVSDCVLFLARYDPLRHRLFKPSFLIMLTYISGEMMIALGMVTIYRAPL